MLEWPPTPPEMLDLSACYGLHFVIGSEIDEGIVGRNICIDAIQACAGVVVDAGRPVTCEEMRQTFGPIHGFELGALGLRALGYHGTGCKRYGWQEGYTGAGSGTLADVSSSTTGHGAHRNDGSGMGDPQCFDPEGCGKGCEISNRGDGQGAGESYINKGTLL